MSRDYTWILTAIAVFIDLSHHENRHNVRTPVFAVRRQEGHLARGCHEIHRPFLPKVSLLLSSHLESIKGEESPDHSFSPELTVLNKKLRRRINTSSPLLDFASPKISTFMSSEEMPSREEDAEGAGWHQHKKWKQPVLFWLSAGGTISVSCVGLEKRWVCAVWSLFILMCWHVAAVQSIELIFLFSALRNVYWDRSGPVWFLYELA